MDISIRKWEIEDAEQLKNAINNQNTVKVIIQNLINKFWFSYLRNAVLIFQITDVWKIPVFLIEVKAISDDK